LGEKTYKFSEKTFGHLKKNKSQMSLKKFEACFIFLNQNKIQEIIGEIFFYSDERKKFDKYLSVDECFLMSYYKDIYKYYFQSFCLIL
jgi:hypothetical protein